MAPKEHPLQLSSPPGTPKAPQTPKRKRAGRAKAAPETPNSKRKRTTKLIKEEGAEERGPVELPHNLGRIQAPTGETAGSPTKTRAPRTPATGTSQKKLVKIETKDNDDKVDNLLEKAAAAPKSGKKVKGYGIKPGETPYPKYARPTPEECHEVRRLLAKEHGEVQQPEKIPLPSLTVSGCGEVPSVLDAMIRTLLSAATSGANSSRAFQGLVQNFGIIEEGIGKGSVDWNKVRLAEQKDVFEAIKSGGLANNKSKNIKAILDKVYEENQTRRKALLANEPAAGAEHESAEEKTKDIAKVEEGVLSLDHFHLLDTNEAFHELTQYPGIGAKTASCVMLFCLKRPSFAVDTHVFRLCQWLGWVPLAGDPAGLPKGANPEKRFTGPNRDSTFAHLDVRIPDELKYPLHQLFIMHGKKCPRCRAITGEGSVDWDKGCPIDHLVKRTGVRKGGTPAKTPKKSAKKAKGKTALDDDDDDDGMEMETESDLEDEGIEMNETPTKRMPTRSSRAKKGAKKGAKKEVRGDESSGLSDPPSSDDEDEDGSVFSP